jgi:hypothetical protein
MHSIDEQLENSGDYHELENKPQGITSDIDPYARGGGSENKPASLHRFAGKSQWVTHKTRSKNME